VSIMTMFWCWMRRARFCAIEASLMADTGMSLFSMKTYDSVLTECCPNSESISRSVDCHFEEQATANKSPSILYARCGDSSSRRAAASGSSRFAGHALDSFNDT